LPLCLVWLLVPSTHAWQMHQPTPRPRSHLVCLSTSEPARTTLPETADVATADVAIPATAFAAKERWEDCRAGTGEGCELGPDGELRRAEPPGLQFDGLHQFEYRVLRIIQRLPGFLPLSMGVHYSLLPKVITPALALLVWLVSLPRGASLIALVCVGDIVNTAVKWSVQRPRPRWYSADSGDLVRACGAWEVDLSFPSAHTQFFSGLAFCASALYHWPLWPALCFGVIIGLTRNFLSMHWPSDTIAGLAVGAALSVLWGKIDPFTVLLNAGSPILSLSVATAFTAGLLCLLLAVRQAVAPIGKAQRASWFANAVASLPSDERESKLANPANSFRPRNIESKIPMLVTVWCTLAITGLYPLALPTAALEPRGSLARRLLQTVVGLAGLGSVGALKRSIGTRASWSDRDKGVWKALTYVAICAWTFLLSQRTFAGLGILGWLPA